MDSSSCGVSIYESAKGLIKKADVQAARLDWEYDSGERAIHVDQRALKTKGGKTFLPRLKKRLYSWRYKPELVRRQRYQLTQNLKGLADPGTSYGQQCIDSQRWSCNY